MRRALLAAAVAAFVAGVIMTTGPVAATSGPGWSVVPTQGPAGVVYSELSGLSCSGAVACTAVGDFEAGRNLDPLAERWDGATFRIQPLPGPPPGATRTVLEGVSCPTATACTAVGYYAIPNGDYGFRRFGLAERWSGTVWSIQPWGGGDAVSCPTVSYCNAVYRQWNGSAWSPVSVPSPPGSTGSVLEGVSCTAVNACTAVGVFYGSSQPVNGATLAERWNGASWSMLPVPSPPGGGDLAGVSCSTATACTAVGTAFESDYRELPLAERWNGTAWSIQPTPVPPGMHAADQPSLSGVSCPAATACTAVGGSDSGTLAEHWDGTAWSIQPAPDTGAGASRLSAVACPSPASCLAVGSQFPGPPLAERFGG